MRQNFARGITPTGAGQKNAPNPLDADGPIVNRARKSLPVIAAEFGEVLRTTRTSATVRTASGLRLELGFLPGNYVFSRVYNLAIRVRLPEGTPFTSQLTLQHRHRGGSLFQPARTAAGVSAEASAQAERLTGLLRSHLSGVDLSTATLKRVGSGIELELSPVGGSYIWNFLPPISMWARFPEGEPDRLIALIHEVLDAQPSTVASPTQQH